MSATKKRGRGRPRLDEGGDAKDVIFSIRMSSGEREEIATASARDGVTSSSDWARTILLAAARARQVES